MELRGYQTEAIERIRQAIREGHRRILVVAPTGSGKTVVGTQILRSAHDKERTGLFLAHRREIIHQTSEKLAQFGLEDHGIIMAGESPSAMAKVSVGSIQTVHSRITTRKNGHQPLADVIIYDEAHRLSSMYLRFADLYPSAIIIGLTATPVRSSGCGLGSFYSHMVEVSTVQELIDQGFLVPTRIFAPSMPDLKGVRTRAGDYVQEDLGEKMDQVQLVGNVVRDWQERAADRQTVVFASTVAHSIHLAERFQEAGVRVAHIDGETPKDERDETLRAFKRGDVQVVVNCQVLSEGFDEPAISCMVLVRPTKSYGLYLQMAGRGLRPYPDKKDCVIIDHAGAFYRHGAPEEAGDWTLDVGTKIQDKRQERKENDPQPMTCRECFAVWTPTRFQRACPSCGWMPTRQGKKLDMKEGRLREVPKAKRKRAHQEDKARVWAECIHIASYKGLKCGAAAHMYRKRIGVWPRGFAGMPKQGEWQTLAKEFLAKRKEANSVGG